MQYNETTLQGTDMGLQAPQAGEQGCRAQQGRFLQRPASTQARQAQQQRRPNSLDLEVQKDEGDDEHDRG